MEPPAPGDVGTSPNLVNKCSVSLLVVIAFTLCSAPILVFGTGPKSFLAFRFKASNQITETYVFLLSTCFLGDLLHSGYFGSYFFCKVVYILRPETKQRISLMPAI